VVRPEAFVLKEHFKDSDSDGPVKAASCARSIGLDAEQMRQAAYQDAQDLFAAIKIASWGF
jgi:hypothetical protein